MQGAPVPYSIACREADAPITTYSTAYKMSNVWKKPKHGFEALPKDDSAPLPDNLVRDLRCVKLPCLVGVSLPSFCQSDESPLPWFPQAMVAINWKRALTLLQSEDFDEFLVEPPTWSKDSGSGVEVGDEEPQVLSLSNCLKQFATCEQLGEMDTWYCPSCKEHVQAFKKMDLWKLNELLCFHLKRFSYEVGQWATHREKLEEFVDFPFEIDMAPFLPPAALAQAQQDFEASGGKGAVSML